MKGCVDMPPRLHAGNARDSLITRSPMLVLLID
jgi:hypothetical protein